MNDAEFVQLYEQHLSAVFNYYLFHSADVQWAEDMTAEVFEKAWRSRHRYDASKASFMTWILRIARNHQIDRARKNRGQIDLRHSLKVAVPAAEEIVFQQLQQARLREMVHALPIKQTELIALKFGAGLSNRQIALVVGKGESAVGSMLFRAIRKLRSQWEAHDVPSQKE